MKYSKIILIFFLFFHARLNSQELQLRGIVNVWNDQSTIITLLDDFHYAFAPGDKIKILVEGTANIAPYDESRKGGGFLGLFKKSYNVRIDNWLTAAQVRLKAKVENYPDIDFTIDGATQVATFEIPFNTNDQKNELSRQFKMKAWVNQYMTPLRAGKYDILVKVDSRDRLAKLENYLVDPAQEPQNLPMLSFENDIKKYVENGKLIYRHPDETVSLIERALGNKPNVDVIKKDLYKYLLRFAPENSSVRAGLAEVYLKELNFLDAQVEAQTTITNLTKKKLEGELSNKEKNDFGRAYEVIAGVNELKELGLQENAYSMGAVFYGQAADWYKEAKSAEEYSKAILKQTRCLQKVGDVIALKQAATILKQFDSDITGW